MSRRSSPESAPAAAATGLDFLEAACLHEQEVAAKTTLLREGQVAQSFYFVRRGCVRLWFNHEGKDLTTQFFVENDAATAIESFLSGEPSLLTMETIEPCSLWVLSRPEFDRLLLESPAFKEWVFQLLAQRLIRSSRRLLSHIRDTPQQRYEELLRTRPYLLQRLPQRYIAAYLGITRVSLSRIRNRK